MKCIKTVGTYNEQRKAEVEQYLFVAVFKEAALFLCYG